MSTVKTYIIFNPVSAAGATGKGYFSIYQIFFPLVAVGVTDFITLSGGMSLL